MVTVEDQLATLGSLGLSLDPGITVDDLLYSGERKELESKPYHLVLFLLGAEVEREPWGRAFSSSVWNFDTECIAGNGDYVANAKRLCVLAGQPDAFAGVCDHVDVDEGEAWVEYTVRGEERHWDIEVQDDWADTMVVAYMMTDLERDGQKFRTMDNGQAMLLFYLDDATTKRLAGLAKTKLTTVTDP